VEDQRPAADDLTAAAATDTEAAELDDTTENLETTETTETGATTGTGATTQTTRATTESTDDAAGSEPADEPADEPAAEPGTRRLRFGRLNAGWFTTRRLTAAAAIAALLFAGSAAFAGAAVQPYLVDRAAVATKTDAARTATAAITTLWSYTPENMDGLADRAATYLSGDFQAQYRKFLDAIVGPNKQAKTSSSTEVVGAAVESLDGRDAVVLVSTHTTSTSPLTKNIPSLKYLSYRVFMTHTNGRWLVTRMATITSLDLTPHV